MAEKIDVARVVGLVSMIDLLRLRAGPELLLLDFSVASAMVPQYHIGLNMSRVIPSIKEGTCPT